MRTSAGQTPVGSSVSSSPRASVAVNVFVTEATRNRASGSHPMASVSTSSPTAVATASDGTSQATAAASQTA